MEARTTGDLVRAAVRGYVHRGKAVLSATVVLVTLAPAPSAFDGAPLATRIFAKSAPWLGRPDPRGCANSPRRLASSRAEQSRRVATDPRHEPVPPNSHGPQRSQTTQRRGVGSGSNLQTPGATGSPSGGTDTNATNASQNITFGTDASGGLNGQRPQPEDEPDSDGRPEDPGEGVLAATTEAAEAAEAAEATLIAMAPPL